MDAAVVWTMTRNGPLEILDSEDEAPVINEWTMRTIEHLGYRDAEETLRMYGR